MGEREEKGEIDGGGEGDYGKVCFLSNAKETLMVNLAPKQTNMTPTQTALICSVLPSPLTVHTITEIFKETSFYERPDVVFLRISKVSIYVSSPQGLVRHHGLFDIDYHFKLIK